MNRIEAGYQAYRKAHAAGGAAFATSNRHALQHLTLLGDKPRKTAA